MVDHLIFLSEIRDGRVNIIDVLNEYIEYPYYKKKITSNTMRNYIGVVETWLRRNKINVNVSRDLLDWSADRVEKGERTAFHLKRSLGSWLSKG